MRPFLLMIGYTLLESFVKISGNAVLARSPPKCKFLQSHTVDMTSMKICVQASRQSTTYENCPEYQFEIGYIEENPPETKFRLMDAFMEKGLPLAHAPTLPPASLMEKPYWWECCCCSL
ncbi:hypothetical protein ANCCAN_17503 [Ancylostoma caninum]|uniref:Uncharacterized protein n=1 Tax=Ancylostoma caninum TaxID=29170 RepID=A0A368G204_ANCCA|nr:hypothetical protein ANCCAN_17503 [Ancylostoma caninum]